MVQEFKVILGYMWTCLKKKKVKSNNDFKGGRNKKKENQRKKNKGRREKKRREKKNQEEGQALQHLGR